MFIDVHCHLNDEKYQSLDEVVNSFKTEQVDYVINAGYDLKSSKKGQVLADKYKEVYFTVGAHPDDEKEVTDDFLQELTLLSNHQKCLGIGEIGLDYHYEGFSKEGQQTAFIKQIELANSLKLPIVVHTRDASFDTLNILKQNKDKLTYGGIMHCYSGSKEMAKEYLDLGLYISFSGTVTFKNAKNLTEVALFTPDDRILTETDSPYLSPMPFRGERNEPKRVPLVTKFLANLRNEDLIEFSHKVKENSKRVFTKL